MSKYRLLDLFCGAGGCSVGYRRAGFDVVGVDHKPQPRYPFPFVETDALEFLSEFGRDFHVVHASPPCQRYSAMTRVHGTNNEHVDLIAETRTRMIDNGRIWVIENVIEAPLRTPVMLCGSMFGLSAKCHDGTTRQLRRHRLFELSHLVLTPACDHAGEPIGVYGHGGGQFKTVWQGGKNRGYMGSRTERKEAMDIDWMSHKELSQAIPPAYTEFIGKQLMQHVR